MWFWKRVEIYCGYSNKEFSELRDALASKDIPYDYKLVDLNVNRNRQGRITASTKNNTLYYLYVHHKDYDQAMHLTSNRIR